MNDVPHLFCISIDQNGASVAAYILQALVARSPGRNGFQVRHYGPLRDPRFARCRFAASYRCKMALRRVNLHPRRVLGPPQAPALDPSGVRFPHRNTTLHRTARRSALSCQQLDGERAEQVLAATPLIDRGNHLA